MNTHWLPPLRIAGWNSRLEWLLLMPRAHAASILRTASLFETCTPRQPSCCDISRSEDLLAHALRAAGPFEEVRPNPNPTPSSNPNPIPTLTLNPNPNPNPNSKPQPQP